MACSEDLAVSSMASEPLILYKYMSLGSTKRLDWTRELLLEDSAYYSSIEHFNDPYEGVFRVSYNAPRDEKIRKAVAMIRKEDPSISIVQAAELAPSRICWVEREGRNRSRERLRSETGIYCLSLQWDNLLMWSHYGDSHRGICVVFRAIPDESMGIVGRALPVSYNDSPGIYNPYYSTKEELVRAAILTKSSVWSYEQEWRIVDYGRPPGHRTISPEAIAGVILGARITHENKIALIEAVSARSIPIKLCQARLYADRFGLEALACEPHPNLAVE